MLWSVGNELSSQPGPVQVAYINAAVKFAKEMDPTRPVGLAVAAYPSSLCQAAEYKSLDVLGLNDYFGWYPGPSGQIFDRTKLSGYLDAARACYPDKALMITEFGAEANRDGPAEEKGTWAFQNEWINYQLGVIGTKPWLSGAIYWALNEFWVRPALGRRQPASHQPDPPEGPDHLRRRAQARLDRGPALVQVDAAVRPGYASEDVTRRRLGRAGSIGLRVRTRRRPGSASLS